MRHIAIALLFGVISSCLSYALLHVNLPLAYVFNPFIVYYFDFEASGANWFGADLAVGALNLIPFLSFGILSMHIRKWALGPWLFGASILIYLGWIISHFL
ncbi:hypothetical protein [Pseudodesulfovibrio sp.]|uniref:hypothetical protein n=1 Tax=Pseudodesulfovibrio sp. TaxID=2035812 RepID=UPI0026355FFF|nr:hypothetical protein [Pseudodesulfovibrio sp.]MDD3311320.1 hypothetical protein [Pseudodesulfovibrio sp.]